MRKLSQILLISRKPVKRGILGTRLMTEVEHFCKRQSFHGCFISFTKSCAAVYVRLRTQKILFLHSTVLSYLKGLGVIRSHG